jgi:hypothetical protein
MIKRNGFDDDIIVIYNYFGVLLRICKKTPAENAAWFLNILIADQ